MGALGRLLAANGPTTGAFQCRMLHGFVSGNSLREAKIIQFADANGRSWLLLDRSWLLLGYSWLLLSYSWGALGRPLAAHGPITGAFQCRMLKNTIFPQENRFARPNIIQFADANGRSWPLLGRSSEDLGPLLAALCPLLAALGYF